MQNQQSNNFSWAIIGSGGISRHFMNTLKTLEETRVAGVLGSHPDKARSFLQENGGPESQDAVVYATIDELIADKNVDAVYVGTPHTKHFEHVELLMTNGIPALCEKPITVTGTQAQTLVELARQNKVFLMEALWTRTLPTWHRVRELIDEGAIGEVDHYSADIGSRYPYDPEHRLFNPELAGGVLLDLGVYPVSLAHMLSGVPEQINGTAVLTDQHVDLKTLIHLRFRDSITASFGLTSQSTSHNAFWVYGSAGQIKVANLFSAAQSVEIIKGGKSTIENYPFAATGFEYQIREAMQCIRAGEIEHPIVTHQSTIEVMAVIDQLRSQLGILPSFSNR